MQEEDTKDTKPAKRIKKEELDDTSTILPKRDRIKEEEDTEPTLITAPRESKVVSKAVKQKSNGLDETVAPRRSSRRNKSS